MKDKLKFYINGQWVESESNEKIEVINPANESIVGHVTAGTKEDIDSAVKAASNAFETYQFSSKEDRIEIRGFGSFSSKRRSKHYANNPSNLEKVLVEEKLFPVFKEK